MVLKRTHGIDKDFWYRQGPMVLTTPMVITKSHGIESVLLNHTRTRGPSVTRMRDFFKLSIVIFILNFDTKQDNNMFQDYWYCETPWSAQ